MASELSAFAHDCAILVPPKVFITPKPCQRIRSKIPGSKPPALSVPLAFARGDHLKCRPACKTLAARPDRCLRPTTVRNSLLSGAVGATSASAQEPDGGIGGDGDDNGSGGEGGGHGGNDGKGGDGKDGGDGNDDEFGPLLDETEVNLILKEKGVTLPADMAAAAAQIGIPAVLLSRYIALQGLAWPLGPCIAIFSALRNRMLADQHFLFKVFAEVAIDSGCATVAEVQKRGPEFWTEFEFYLSDLLVGLVLDVALVGLLAPTVSFAPQPAAAVGMGQVLSKYLGALPNSVFEAATPGRSFTVSQRAACYVYKMAQYLVAGTACGAVGQGIANSIMHLKRKLNSNNTGAEVDIPPLAQTALLWGVFMAVSSNTRYQIVNGLERVVESSPLTKRFPFASNAFTIGIRFANNIYGGMQFVDWARLVGVQ